MFFIYEADSATSDISMSVGPNGFALGCAAVVSDTRSVEAGRFCDRIVAETTPVNDILAFVYGTADAFTLTVEPNFAEQ